MINLVPDYYVMDQDCHWKNGKPVNSEYWESFKKYIEDLQAWGKPMEVTLDFINKVFNPVLHPMGHVIRDQEFAFVSHIKEKKLKATFLPDRGAYLIEHPHGPRTYAPYQSLT
jgi:hypothetical protein